MSTLGQPNLEASWKEEVNRRLAAHKNRKGASPAPHPQGQQHQPVNSRAADAAARVAARYAKAPSYSQMQAEEARVAVRAAEIATKVALEAQAAAESALAELHAATEQTSRGPAVVESITRARKEPEAAAVQVEEPIAAPVEPFIAEPVEALVEEPEMFVEPEIAPVEVPEPTTPERATQEHATGQVFDIRWEPDMPSRTTEHKASVARTQANFALSAEDWWTPAETSSPLYSEPIEVAESEPAHANLIQFPRELVASRKLRPRLAESQGSPSLSEGQLSIFEVDPQAVPAEIETMQGIADTQDAWTGARWSGMELDAHPATEPAPRIDTELHALPHMATLAQRLLAGVVDGALVLAVFFALSIGAMAETAHPLPLRSAEVLGGISLFLIGLLYHAVFFLMGRRTPGMSYAGIWLCTFEDETPSRRQLQQRLATMVVSVLPLGLGMLWSVFDEDHLSWHDRMSQTYLRQRF